MKRTYKLHYNQNLNFENDTLKEVTIEEVGVCPCCHIATSPTFINGYLIASKDNYIQPTAFIIFYCTNCRELYIAKYYIPMGIGYDNIDVFPYAVYPQSAKVPSFSDDIFCLSPMFIDTYKQACYAEANENTIGLAGLGYRKALEFLIKDYLIKIKHQDRDTIIQLELGKCVDKLEKDLQDIAKASVWLGNDETHYFRKNTDYSIQDLKMFIDCLVKDIEREFVKIKAKKLVHSKQ